MKILANVLKQDNKSYKMNFVLTGNEQIIAAVVS